MLELMENLDLEYKEIEHDDVTSEVNKLNFENLKRIITLNNIKKYKINSDMNHLGIIDINKFKAKLRDCEQNLIKAVHILGPPKYIKSKFKISTIKKYYMHVGSYFGKARKGLMTTVDNFENK